MIGDDKVVDFRRPDDDERARRLNDAAESLASPSRAVGEWLVWLPRDAAKLGVPEDKLREVVEAKIAAREKEQAKAERERKEAEQKAERRESTDRKEKAAAADKQDRERAKRKKEIFKAAAKVPAIERDKRLDALAAEMGQTREAIDDEFQAFALTLKEPLALPSAEAADQPWDEPVNLKDLLRDLRDFLGRGIVLMDFVAPIVTAHIPFCWLHNDIAQHSPILGLSSPEPNSGKTTLIARLRRLVPDPMVFVEMTGPTMYRRIDANRPTLFVDESDSIFDRRSDLVHIVSAAWTPGTTIPRGDHDFNVWCAKIIAFLIPEEKDPDKVLPRQLNTRVIDCPVWRMTPEEEAKLEAYKATEAYRNEEAECTMFRRKLLRWKIDNAEAMRYLIPTYPPGFKSRLAQNWRLQLLIAERAGGIWPEELRHSAMEVSRHLLYGDPSEGVALLMVVKSLLASWPKGYITSAELLNHVLKQKGDYWRKFRGKGPISETQLAALLRRFRIRPRNIHPTKRSTKTVRGYVVADFREPIARYARDAPAEVDAAFVDDDDEPVVPKRKPRRKSRRRSRRKGKR
jgi:hypothetical protein